MHRYRTVEVGDGEGQTTVRLKKWSAAKLFCIARELWSVFESAIEDLDLDKISEASLIAKVIEVVLQTETKAAWVITLSIDSPDGIDSAKVLDWDADEFVSVLTSIVEMNITDDLVKNFQKLLASVKKSPSEGAEELEEATTSAG